MNFFLICIYIRIKSRCAKTKGAQKKLANNSLETAVKLASELAKQIVPLGPHQEVIQNTRHSQKIKKTNYGAWFCVLNCSQ